MQLCLLGLRRKRTAKWPLRPRGGSPRVFRVGQAIGDVAASAAAELGLGGLIGAVDR